MSFFHCCFIAKHEGPYAPLGKFANVMISVLDLTCRLSDILVLDERNCVITAAQWTKMQTQKLVPVTATLSKMLQEHYKYS